MVEDKRYKNEVLQKLFNDDKTDRVMDKPLILRQGLFDYKRLSQYRSLNFQVNGWHSQSVDCNHDVRLMNQYQFHKC